MKINETILIFAISILGLCILCGIIKLLTKSNETGERYNNACYILFLVSVVLIGVSQLMSGLNSRETMTVGEKVDTPLDRCSKNSSCLNGGVSVEKWPIDLSKDAQCVCNCVGGFSGDTCENDPLDDTKPYTWFGEGTFSGLSNKKCDARYGKRTNPPCWQCEYGNSKGAYDIDGQTYCCSNTQGGYCGILQGDPHGGKKTCIGEAGMPTKFCSSDKDCSYYVYPDGNMSSPNFCNTMDPPQANVLNPGDGCDRRPGYKNSCCKCQYGIVSSVGKDYCCKRDMSKSSKLEDGCKYQSWTDSSGEYHPGNWSTTLQPQTLCNSTPNNIFTFTIPELDTIPLQPISTVTVTYDVSINNSEGKIISYTANGASSYLVIEKTSGPSPSLYSYPTLTMNSPDITPHTMTPTAIDQNFMGVDTACHGCAYGYYWGGVNDFCCDKHTAVPDLAGQICDTRKGHKNQCATCPYGKTRHGLNDWCCGEEENCPPYCTVMEKPIGRLNICLSQKYI